MENNFIQHLEKLEHSSASCITNWKQGNDPGCYQEFILTLECFESMVDCHFDRFVVEKEEIIKIIEQLDQRVRNKDMIAIIDVLEYDFIPLLRKWRQLNNPSKI